MTNRTIQTHAFNIRAKTRTDVFASEIQTNNVVVGNAIILESFNSQQLNAKQANSAIAKNVVVGMYRGYKNPFAPLTTITPQPTGPILLPIITSQRPNAPITIAPTPSFTPPFKTPRPVITPAPPPPIPTAPNPVITTRPAPPSPTDTRSTALTITQTTIVNTPAYTVAPAAPSLDRGLSLWSAMGGWVRTLDINGDGYKDDKSIKEICNSTPTNPSNAGAGYFCEAVMPHIPNFGKDSTQDYTTLSAMRAAARIRAFDAAPIWDGPPIADEVAGVRSATYGGGTVGTQSYGKYAGRSIASDDKKLENVFQCYSYDTTPGKSQVIERCCIRVPAMYVPDLGVDTSSKTSLFDTLKNPDMEEANRKWRRMWNSEPNSPAVGKRIWDAKFGEVTPQGLDNVNRLAQDFQDDCLRLRDDYTYYDPEFGTIVTDPDEYGAQLYDMISKETCICAPPIVQMQSETYLSVMQNVNINAAIVGSQTAGTFLDADTVSLAQGAVLVDEFGDPRPKKYAHYTPAQELALLGQKQKNFGSSDIGKIGTNAVVHEYNNGFWKLKDGDWSPNIIDDALSNWTNEYQVCYYTESLDQVEEKCWKSGLFFARESCKQYLKTRSLDPDDFLHPGTIEPASQHLSAGRFDMKQPDAFNKLLAYVNYLDCLQPLLSGGRTVLNDIRSRFMPICDQEINENRVGGLECVTPELAKAMASGASVGLKIEGGTGSYSDGDYNNDGWINGLDFVGRAIDLIKKQNIIVSRGGPYVTFNRPNDSFYVPPDGQPPSEPPTIPPPIPSVDGNGNPNYGGGGGGGGSKTPAKRADDQHLSNCPPTSALTTDFTPQENKTYTRKNVYYPTLSGWTDWSRRIESCITYTLIVVKKHQCAADSAWKLGQDKDQFRYFYVVHNSNGTPYDVGNQITSQPPIASPTGWVISTEHTDYYPELYATNGSNTQISVKDGRITSNTYTETNHGLKSALEYEGGHAVGLNEPRDWGSGTYYGFHNDGVYDCTGQKIKFSCLTLAYVDNQPFMYGDFYGAVPAQGNLSPVYTTEGKVIGGQVERSPSCFSECREVNGVCYCFNKVIDNTKHPSAARCEQKNGGDYGTGVEYDCYCQPIKLITTPAIGTSFFNEFACGNGTSDVTQNAKSECEANGGCWATFQGNCGCTTRATIAQYCLGKGQCVKDDWCTAANPCKDCNCTCIDESTGACIVCEEGTCPGVINPCECVDFTQLSEECAWKFQCAAGCDCLDYTIMEAECTQRGEEEERILCVDPNEPCDCIAIEEMKDACKTAFDTCAWPEAQMGDGSPSRCGCLSEADFENACKNAGIADNGESRCPDPNDACSCISWDDAAEGCTECKPLPNECGCRTRSDADDYCASIFKCINPDTANTYCDCFDKGKVPCPGGCNVPNTCTCLSEAEMNTQMIACSANPGKMWKNCACVDDPSACQCPPPPEHAEDDCWTKEQWASYCVANGNCPASQYNTNVGGGYGGGNGCECAGTPQEIEENCTECYGGEDSPCSCFTAAQIAESCEASNVCVDPDNSCQCVEAGNTPTCPSGSCLAGCDCVADNSSYCGDETPCYIQPCQCFNQLDYCAEQGKCSPDDGTCNCNDIPTNAECAQYASTPCGGECSCRDTNTFKNECESSGRIAGEDCECFDQQECESNCNSCTECCYKCKCKTYAQMKSVCAEKNQVVNPTNKCECTDNAEDECKKIGSCLRTYTDENGQEASECLAPYEYCEKLGEIYCIEKEACTCVEPCDDNECERKDACNDCVEALPVCNGTWHTGDYTCTCPFTIYAGDCGCCQETANTANISPCSYNGSEYVKDQACTWTCGDESFSGKITAELGGDGCRAAWINCNCCNSTTCSSDCTQ